jgi:hypothetical protein
MANTTQLGAELGEHFARERALGSDQEREARQLIDQIMAREPRVKLPRLLADERVQSWQKQTGVTDAHLKKALTTARAERKADPEPDPIKVPVRTRRRQTFGLPPRATATTGEKQQVAESQRGVVPNQDLTLL